MRTTILRTIREGLFYDILSRNLHKIKEMIRLILGGTHTRQTAEYASVFEELWLEHSEQVERSQESYQVGSYRPW